MRQGQIQSGFSFFLTVSFLSRLRNGDVNQPGARRLIIRLREYRGLMMRLGESRTSIGDNSDEGEVLG